MNADTGHLDFSNAVNYHYDRFPPKSINFERLLTPIAQASEAIARYDQMLKGMHNSEILLAPLRSQEAVVSSRMEGTVSTLDEVLQYEADQEGGDRETRYRPEAVEVFLYGQAMRRAQAAIHDGQPISSHLMRSTHRVLLGFGRGQTQSPGEFKTEQNYLADPSRKKVLFVPISPQQLETGLERLFDFIEDENWQILIRTALAHLEFEALHPFKDGNGRVGRMLITLMLWHYKVVSEPHFYISGVLEANRDEYIDLMRAVSEHDNWTDWIVFFLQSLEQQAKENLKKSEQIRSLYEDMKDKFREILSSQWSAVALDFVFSRPVFRNNAFTHSSGIPPQTAHRFTRILADERLLVTNQPASGRRPALYSFEPLLKLVRG